jgi:hypothetical protein
MNTYENVYQVRVITEAENAEIALRVQMEDLENVAYEVVLLEGDSHEYVRG